VKLQPLERTKTGKRFSLTVSHIPLVVPQDISCSSTRVAEVVIRTDAGPKHCTVLSFPVFLLKKRRSPESRGCLRFKLDLLLRLFSVFKAHTSLIYIMSLILLAPEFHEAITRGFFPTYSLKLCGNIHEMQLRGSGRTRGWPAIGLSVSLCRSCRGWYASCLFTNDLVVYIYGMPRIFHYDFPALKGPRCFICQIFFKRNLGSLVSRSPCWIGVLEMLGSKLDVVLA
jgi:hypothetical protein